MSKTIFLIILEFLQLVTFSQTGNDKKKEDKSYRSQIFGEGAGPGVMISINYEKKIGQGKSFIAVRGGTGLVIFSGFGNTGFTIPLGLSYIHRERLSYELGGGLAPLILTGKNNSGTELLIYSLIGYRYVFRDSPLIGRIFFSPLFVKKGSIISSNFEIKGQFIPYGGISLGVAF